MKSGVLSCLVCAVVAILLQAGCSPESPLVEVTGVALDTDRLSLLIGEARQLAGGESHQMADAMSYPLMPSVETPSMIYRCRKA